jgi:hypothetical protein
MEETHLQHMKALLGSFAHSVEDTHVQIGQVRGQDGRTDGLGTDGRPQPLPFTPLSPRCTRSSSRTLKT